MSGLIDWVLFLWLWAAPTSIVVLMYCRLRHGRSSATIGFGRATVHFLFTFLPILFVEFLLFVGIPPISDASWSLFRWFLIALTFAAGWNFFSTTDGRIRWAAIAAQLLIVMLTAAVAIDRTHLAGDKVFNKLTPIVEQTVAAACEDAAGDPTIVHMSDLHLVGNAPSKESGVAGNQALKEFLPVLGRSNPRYVIVSGDITDSATDAEWKQAIRELKSVPDTAAVILAPGNHDLSPALPDPDFSSCSPELSHDAACANRMKRFLLSAIGLAPGLRTAGGNALAKEVERAPKPPDADSYAASQAELQSCKSLCASDASITAGGKGIAAGRIGLCRLKCGVRYPKAAAIVDQHYANSGFFEREAREFFPLQFVDHGLAVFVLLSVGKVESEWLGTNGIGHIDKDQAGRLKAAIAALPDDIRDVVIVLHHPIARISSEHFGFPDLLACVADLNECSDELQKDLWWAYSLLGTDVEGANRIMAILEAASRSKPARRYYVLHGHRHMRSAGTRNGITFLEAPNVAATAPNRGFYSIALGNVPKVNWCNVP